MSVNWTLRSSPCCSQLGRRTTTPDYGAYRRAIIEAKNVTEKDLLRMWNVRLRTVPNIMILITCIAVAKDKPLRTMAFSDVHSCNSGKWKQLYTFTTFTRSLPPSSFPFCIGEVSQPKRA
ncbi:hypothetical protein BG011_004589 [Mortierella polycephala]|uniref:Uncharacterized protein n=1 Tax=Mortierella polycephala TaxID=41804 RepID=A0A9P6U2I3_9FUNG|nr:hypothetical protein BG011_004589 [Mortierella polycephala]